MYVGQYKLINAPEPVIQAGGEIYTIVQKNDQLFVRSKLGEQELYPESETKFRLENKSIINFAKEGNKVIGMVIDLMGLGARIVKANKID
jgi:hypothetical protein